MARLAAPDLLCWQDPDLPRDKVIVALIMVAVALPTRLIIGRLFEISNRPAGKFQPFRLESFMYLFSFS